MDLRLGDVALRQFPVESGYDHHGPTPMKTLPRPVVSERRAEVIAKWHDGNLLGSRVTDNRSGSQSVILTKM